jgi:hypothetical protein
MMVKAKTTVHDHLVDESDNPSLTVNKAYHAISISYDCFRVIDDDGEPYLFSKKLFNIIDPHIPDHWIAEIDDEDGEVIFVGPREFSKQGFFEDYFDGVKSVVEEYERCLKFEGINIDNFLQ